MAREPSELSDRIAKSVQDAVQHTHIKYLPQSFTRGAFDRMNQCRVISLVNVVLVLEYSWHRHQRSLLEDHPSETDPRETNQDRNQSKPTLRRNLFTRMRGVRHVLSGHNYSFVRTLSGNGNRLAMCRRRHRSHRRFKRVLEYVNVLMRECRTQRVRHTDKTTDRR